MSFAVDLQKQIEEAVALLERGEAVAVPTETVYGLAARIDRTESIEKIFRLKERPFFDPLIVHIGQESDLAGVAEPPSPAETVLMRALWPGPCTFILRKKKELNPLITSGLESVGVRMPSHPVAREILARLKVPFAAPSANKFGKTSPTKAAHVRSEWPDGEVFVVDAGSSEHGLESSVIRVSEEGNRALVEILRPGVITEARIREVLEQAGSAVVIRRAESNASPGHTEHHYMPTVPLAVILPESLPLTSESEAELRSLLGVPSGRFAILTLSDDPKIAARELYEKLHELSASGASAILCPVPLHRRVNTETELWAAIWDRLSRAAAKIL